MIGFALNQAITGCLSSMDAIIAAVAPPHEATLVHRDPHFQAMPADLLKQEVLTGIQAASRLRRKCVTSSP